MTHFVSDRLQLTVPWGSKDLRIPLAARPAIRLDGVLRRAGRLALPSQDNEELIRSTASVQRFQGIGQLGFGPAADSHQVARLGTDRLAEL